MRRGQHEWKAAIRPFDKPKAGFSLVETMMGLALLAIVMTTAMAYLVMAWQSVHVGQDRIFCTQKAISILNEIRSYVETKTGEKFGSLDSLDDGINTSPYLTIANVTDPTKVTSPSHEASGNVLQDGQWKFTRHVTVRPLPNVPARDIRLVIVKVYARNKQGEEVLKADVGSVVHTVSDAFPTTQVYDVYALCVENVPGWWTYMSRIRPFMEATLTDLQNRNPGLKFRMHWITKLSYGRDSEYCPIMNDGEVDSRQTVDYVYFYPGKMPAAQTDVISSDYYYVPNITGARYWLKDHLASGATRQNDYDGSGAVATHNVYPYSLADVYNHSMRYQDELTWFNARCSDTATKPDGTLDYRESSDQPTWRLLLDDMIANPAKYTNVIFINLHGELLPMPPLRNYSDPAKDPANYLNWRVVTHPENLWYFRSGVSTNNSEEPKLRVYAFHTSPDSIAITTRMTVPITITIDSVDLSAVGALTVQCIEGGTTSSEKYVLSTATTTPGSTMYYTASYDGTSSPSKTVLKLYNTPLRCLQNSYTSGKYQGLATGARLYGYEYVPCPVEKGGDFSRSLYNPEDTSGGKERNTARWIITIPKTNLGTNISNTDQVLTVTTIIGDESLNPVIPGTVPARKYVSGTMYPPTERYKPQNISRTYIYWSSDSTYVPFTERYQFFGDPRHCPYGDLKNNDRTTYTSVTTWTGPHYKNDSNQYVPKTFPDGYNWYFDNFRNSSTDTMAAGGLWDTTTSGTSSGFDKARIKNSVGANSDGWDSDMNEVDTPRFFLTLRTALTQTKALFTTLTGWSFYYMCYGGEIGYDLANGYKYGIPVSGKPYGGSSYGWDQWMVDSTDALGTPNWGSGVKYIRENVSSTPYWWGKNWIGELFPDSVYTSQWAVNGNLNSGTTTGSGIFIRTLRSKINCNLPTGTTFLNASSTTQATKRRTYREGCTSFFNYESSGKQFHHQGVDNTYGTLTAAGNDMAVTYFFPLPSSAPISRPFNLNLGGTSEYPTGNEWSYTTDYPRFTAKTMETFYLHSNGNLGSALIGLRPDTTKSAYVVVSGIDRTTESGTPFIAKYSLISLIHGFLTAGYNNWDASGNTSPLVVHELPCIKIKEPTGITELKRPTTITVRWGIQWRRWDGQPYTASHSSGYGGENDESDLRYTACYSTDSGVTWKFMVDDSANSNSGYLPTNSTYVLEDETSGADESFDWDVSDTTKFPEGSYLIRIEAFRNSLKLHYAWHMERIFIDRR